MRERTRTSLPLPLLLALLLPPPLWGGPPEPEPERDRHRDRGPLQPFDVLYASGVAAYYGGDYERAVRDLEAALRSHRRLRETRVRCARHCAARRPLAPPGGAGPGSELPFFRALLERARCQRSCWSQRLGGPESLYRASEDVRSDFQRRVPYNYLQRAYLKVRGTRAPPAPRPLRAGVFRGAPHLLLVAVLFYVFRAGSLKHWSQNCDSSHLVDQAL